MVNAPRLSGNACWIARAGAGPAPGHRLRVSPKFVSLAIGEWRYLPLQEPRTTFSVAATARWEIGRDVAVNLDGRIQPSASESVFTSMFYY